MGPALERLLARPAALQLLRGLLGHKPHDTSLPSIAQLHPDCNFRCTYTTSNQWQRRYPHTVSPSSRSWTHRLHTRALDTRQPKTQPDQKSSGQDSLTSYPRIRELLGDCRNVRAALKFQTTLNPLPDTYEPGDPVRRPWVQAEFSHDWTLWAEIMQYRKSMDGYVGVAFVWKALAQMPHVGEIPTEGAVANDLWDNLLFAAARSSTITESDLTEIAHKLQVKGKKLYNARYHAIMGYTMRKTPRYARAYFEHLRILMTLPHDAASCLIEDTMQSVNHEMAFDAFRFIYLYHNERNLYDRCLAVLEKYKVDSPQFYRWHRMLLQENDQPSTSTRTMSLVRDFFRRDESTARNLGQRDASDSEISAIHAQSIRMTREGMNELVGGVHGIKKKTVSDDFSARLFATHVLPLDFIFGSLHMFGTDSIGPLAMREMALRSNSSAEFLDDVQRARKAGLIPENTPFFNALRVLAIERREDLFQTLMSLDEHPQTYSATDIQHRLLDEILAKGDLSEAHTLLKLLLRSNLDWLSSTWNRVAMLCEEARNVNVLESVLSDMLDNNIEVYGSTLKGLSRHCLRPRAGSKQPLTLYQDGNFGQNPRDLEHVTQLYMMFLEADIPVYYGHWVEILKRYGMRCRLREIKNICLRLLPYYAPRQDEGPIGHTYRQKRAVVNETFDAPSSIGEVSTISDKESKSRGPVGALMQRAIVSWGFQNQSAYWHQTNASSTYSPVYGISVLRTLEDEGLAIDLAEIRGEIIHRLWILHGPGRSHRLRNRAIRRAAIESLSSRFRQVQEAWGDNRLFPEFGSLPVDEATSVHLYFRLFWSRMLNKRWRRAYTRLQIDIAESIRQQVNKPRVDSMITEATKNVLNGGDDDAHEDDNIGHQTDSANDDDANSASIAESKRSQEDTTVPSGLAMLEHYSSL